MPPSIIIALSPPETKSVKNDFNGSHLFSQIKAAEQGTSDLIISSLTRAIATGFYLPSSPYIWSFLNYTHSLCKARNPAHSHIYYHKNNLELLSMAE